MEVTSWSAGICGWPKSCGGGPACVCTNIGGGWAVKTKIYKIIRHHNFFFKTRYFKELELTPGKNIYLLAILYDQTEQNVNYL